MNIVNWALPMDQLGAKVDEVVAKLLARPARTLARTKRAVNKHLVQQVNLAYDALHYSELLDFYELGRDSWRPDLAFRPEPPTSS